MPNYSSRFWEFDNMTPITLYESTLPKLGFQLNSWKKSTRCLCMWTNRRKRHSPPSELPLYPFPDTPEKQSFKWQAECLQANLEYTDISREPIDMVFGIKPGAFYDAIIPETVQSLWGPVPLERLPEGLDNTCRTVTHDIVTGMEDKRMSVYLIHSLPLVLSAVQVYVGSQMAVVAHSVGPDTIGAMSVLELDSSFAGKPWRAMIIKDNEGDFGICVGAWVGVKKGVPGVKGSRNRKGIPGTPGNPGHFKMLYYNLRTKKHITRRIVSSDTIKCYLDLEDVEVDWDSGNILVKKESGYIAQHICLAFVTSTLYLLVQPRPENVEEEEEKWIAKKAASLAVSYRYAREARAARAALITPPFMRNAALLMLIYSGWRECRRMPSNSSVLYESRRKRPAGESSWPYFFWASGCWGGSGLHYHDPGLYADTDLGLDFEGFTDAFTDAVDFFSDAADMGEGGDVFSGCGGCGGCGGDTGGMSGGKKFVHIVSRNFH